MATVKNFRALQSDYRWNAMTTKGTPVFVTYSFLKNSEVPSLSEYEPYNNDGYFRFSNAQQSGFREAVAEYERVSGVRFVEVDDPDDAMVRVMNTDGSDWGGWAGYGIGTRDYTNQVYLVIDGQGRYQPGSGYFEVLLHELGHVSGLKHPFEGDPRLVDYLDNENHTLMSYTSNGKADRHLAHLDIDALQNLYGRSGKIGDGWHWRFDDATHQFILKGAAGRDKLIGVDGHSAIFGRGGNDQIFGRDGDDVARGQGGNDYFMLGMGNNEAYGGTGNDRFFDYLGDDLFDGGGGEDTIVFKYAAVSVFVDLGETGPQFNLGENRLLSIENAIGSAQDDRLTGSEFANLLKGKDGWDVLIGNDGDDVLAGGNGVDELDGGLGDDALVGGAGDDTLTGGAGRDEFRFRPNHGTDQVSDFVVGEDLLAFYGFSFRSKAAALARFYEIGSDSDNMVGFSYKGTTVIVTGADLGDLSSADLLI